MIEAPAPAATNQEILRVIHDALDRLDRLTAKQDELERLIHLLRADSAGR
jgi:hypothetical protein